MLRDVWRVDYFFLKRNDVGWIHVKPICHSYWRRRVRGYNTVLWHINSKVKVWAEGKEVLQSS